MPQWETARETELRNSLAPAVRCSVRQRANGPNRPRGAPRLTPTLCLQSPIGIEMYLAALPRSPVPAFASMCTPARLINMVNADQPFERVVCDCLSGPRSGWCPPWFLPRGGIRDASREDSDAPGARSALFDDCRGVGQRDRPAAQSGAVDRPADAAVAGDGRARLAAAAGTERRGAGGTALHRGRHQAGSSPACEAPIGPRFIAS